MTSASTGTRILGLVSAAWGGALFAEGRSWWTSMTHRPPTATDKAAIAVLASRQLGQGLAQVLAPDRLRRTWLVVDLAHAGSMVVLAKRRPSLRRPALLSAGVAAASAAAGTALARSAR